MTGIIIWWGRIPTQRNFGIVEVKNADFSVDKYFLHRRNIIKMVPEFPAEDQIVKFEISPEKPRPGKLPEAIQAELYNSKAEIAGLELLASKEGAR